MNRETEPHDTSNPLQEQRAAAPMGMVLHVNDIQAASHFYQSLGFSETGAFPRADGQIVVAFLTFGPCVLILGRRDELHYENEARARLIESGPPGLGVVVTLLVPDLSKIYDTVRAAGLPILLEPVDEFYGDRVFMFLDPEGYEWKISQTVAQVGEREVREIIAAS